MAISAEVVKDHASGHWLSIIKNLAPVLAQATEKTGRHVPCPVHGGRDGFRLFKDADRTGGGICNTCGPLSDGFSLLMWVNGWSFPDAVEAVGENLGLSATYPKRRVLQARPSTGKNATRSQREDRKIKLLLAKLWNETLPISHPDAAPVRRYLRNRGLDDDLPDWPALRFHPAMQYRDDEGGVLGLFPAMVALLEHNGRPVTIHRTYLTDDGRKAPVACPKKMMASASDRPIPGSAIRLGRPGRVLCVAEGIETALAVYCATGMVTWPLVSSSLMPSFAIPKGVEKLIIWSDLDTPSPKTGLRTGRVAAETLADRAHELGVDAEIREPVGLLEEDQKIDWLDIYNSHGPNAFCRMRPERFC